MGFSLPWTGLGFCFFSISSRTFQLLEFSNLSKIVVGGREREKKEYVACVNMCTFVYFSCRNYWISCIMPEKCQNCKKTSKSQLKKFLCWFYSFKYFRGKLLGSSSKDFFGQHHLLTWLEAFPFSHALIEATKSVAKCLYSYWDSLLQKRFGHNNCPRCNMFTSVPHCVVCEMSLKQNIRY